MVAAAKSAVELAVKKEIITQLKAQDGEWFELFDAHGNTKAIQTQVTALATQLSSLATAQAQNLTDVTTVKTETSKLLDEGLKHLTSNLKSTAAISMSNNAQIDAVTALFR